MKLIAEGEHQTLDFKYAVSDSRKIARTLIAFANSNGGRLLIGVKDNGKIKGIHSDEEIHMIDTAANLFCRPVPEYKTEVWDVEGKNVLEVIVPEQEKRPFRAPDDEGRWRAYVRVGDNTFIANRVLIRTWKRKKNPKGALVTYTAPEKLLLHYLNEHPEISQQAFRKMAGIPGYIAENILVKLLSWQVISIRFTDRGIRYVMNEKFTDEADPF